MVMQNQPPPNTLNMNITSAITLGGDLDVNGNAFTVNGRFNGCGVNGGVSAVRAEELSQPWRPWRSYATLLLWQEKGEGGTVSAS